MNHEYTSAAYSENENDTICKVIKPGGTLYQERECMGVYELHQDLQKDGVVPVWDEYYIKEIIVNDTILDESKWRNEDCWEKRLFSNLPNNVLYILHITENGINPNYPNPYQ